MKKEITNRGNSSVLLLAFIIVTFVTVLTNGLIQQLVDDWFNKRPIVIFMLILQILRTVVYFLPALAIKDQTYRYIGLVITALMVAYLLINPITTF